MVATPVPLELDVETLRHEIQKEYREVADHPDQGFHFHTGRALAKIVHYREEWLAAVPEEVLASFAGTGNPISMGEMKPGEKVVDPSCGAGIDSFIAASQVGPTGAVFGIDMTPEMMEKARWGAAKDKLPQLVFKQGHLEEIPLPDHWANVVISNGVVNLSPDKVAAFREIYRVLKPGGRIQIADILVTKAVSAAAKNKIDLWTG